MKNVSVQDPSNLLQDTLENLKDSAKSAFENSSEEVKKGGKAWLKYIKAHPLQSVLFGAVAYFAAKGLCK